MVWELKVGTGEIAKASQVQLPDCGSHSLSAPAQVLRCSFVVNEGGQQAAGHCDSVVS